MNLNKVLEACSTLCEYCESDGCGYCQVSRLCNDAEIELGLFDQEDIDEDEDDSHISSSTCRDYGPSNPWDAPGMSVKDFI